MPVEPKDPDVTFVISFAEAEAVRAYIAGDHFDADVVGMLHRKLDRFIDENEKREDDPA